MTKTTALRVSPPAISEREFLAQILEVAGKLGYLRAHFRPAMTKYGWRTPTQGEKGFVDAVLVRSPRVLFIETKSAKGKLDPMQEQWRMALEACPGVSYHLWRVGKVSLQEIAEKLR